LSPMAVFIMALITKAGAQTLYQLKKLGALSYGGIRPTLEGLHEDGYLSKAASEGDLGKKQLAVTSAGLKAFEETWRWNLGEATRGDVDTILRLAWVAQTMGEEETATTFLRSAADFRRKELERLSDKKVGSTPGMSYRRLRAVAARHQNQSEADLLEKLSHNFDECFTK
jgi:DNA-binding PadR family transcriptional regulator